MHSAPSSNNNIKVNNAGLVLINSYILLLFERLHLLSENLNVIINPALAVKTLNFIALGIEANAELNTPLCKLLCSVPQSQNLTGASELLPEQIELINGLINAMIDHWPAIGNSSIDGFRGNWLVRDGLLTEYEDKWELTVEKRAYDLLIYKSPFSFSIIKFHWMQKPLHVNWLY
ncbi:contractile injection system tape measure protein [Mucilaginibacter sp. FT3.2]|uniref:contractile injection system tape measure protein n=1 Tax=Mucilaginibacter sp. FT3.2 TaxID=2723090 RepID=UPI00161E77C0|nr:contractile injection system tape measure protein [Mucilaginibacter sp. FT3.2]MBB6230147.1 hypothetical protein [Mucilaginibacter sp. FT3.2]